jgi:hypothetical protein
MAAISVLSSPFVAGALLFLRCGEESFFGGEDGSSSTGRAMYGSSLTFVLRKDRFPRLGGPAVVSSLRAAAVAASGSPSSTMAAPDCPFLYQHQSGSGRRSFTMLGASWWVHGVGSCGVPSAWSCSLELTDGFVSGFTVRSFFDLDQRRDERRSAPVMVGDLGLGLYVFCLFPRVFLIKFVLCSQV